VTAADVTVVVPVYNPGASIDPAIDSLLAQTLPPGRLEIIFVDDGSTDGVSDRLDRLAEEHPHVTVIHQPNSGWPGLPRNVGTDAATGAYIQFMDQDDVLGAEALERLHAMGVAHDSDIVIGKITSNFRTVPLDLFRENVARCSLTYPPLIHSLTPHKLFRRGFLLDTGIRYPEGRRRLEDQAFVVECFLATDSIAVLSDYPCYYYLSRADRGNAGAVASDPAVYYENLREVLDIVEGHTQPGTQQDMLLARFFNDLIRRMKGIATNDLTPEYVEAFFAEVRRTATERFPSSVPDRLPTMRRYSAAALLTDRMDQVVDINLRIRAVKASATLEELTWSGDRWIAQLKAGLTHVEDGSAIVVVPADGGWHPDSRLTPDSMVVRADSTAELLVNARCDVIVRESTSKVEWLAASTIGARLDPMPDRADGAHQLVFHGAAELHPTMPFGTERLAAGNWSVLVRIRALGLTRIVALRSPDQDRRTVALVRPQPTQVVLRATGSTRRIQLVVRPANSVTAVVARQASPVLIESGTLVMPTALHLVGGDLPIAATVIVGDKSGERARRPAEITATADGAVLHCRLDGASRLPRGEHTISLQIRPKERPQPIGALSVGWRGHASARAR
jgi:poly(ribitol-phosphate) beta-N-acetylglucosaminyltransferase